MGGQLHNVAVMRAMLIDLWCANEKIEKKSKENINQNVDVDVKALGVVQHR